MRRPNMIIDKVHIFPKEGRHQIRWDEQIIA